MQTTILQALLCSACGYATTHTSLGHHSQHNPLQQHIPQLLMEQQQLMNTNRCRAAADLQSSWHMLRLQFENLPIQGSLVPGKRTCCCCCIVLVLNNSLFMLLFMRLLTLHLLLKIMTFA
jgi:hypothetical protein